MKKNGVPTDRVGAVSPMPVTMLYRAAPNTASVRSGVILQHEPNILRQKFPMSKEMGSDTAGSWGNVRTTTDTTL